MKVIAIIPATMLLLPAVATAQRVGVPASANGTAATATYTAGNAVGIAPKAHEVPAQVVGSTVPAYKPVTSGVTHAGADISRGVNTSGDNVAKNGIGVYPAGSVGKTQQDYQKRAVDDTIAQAKKVPPSQERLKCDAQELAMGECQ